MTPADRVSFVATLARKLETEANQIRQLIGGKHWLTDGRHKETLVRSFVQPHLPSAVECSNGFVISASDERASSREQDLLIFYTDQAQPLLRTGDVSFCYASSVAAAISVKSTLCARSVRDTIRVLCSSRLLPNRSHELFAFFFHEWNKPVELNDLAERLCARIADCEDCLPLEGSILCRIDSDLYARMSWDAKQYKTCCYTIEGFASQLWLSHLVDAATHGAGDGRSLLAELIDNCAPNSTPSVATLARNAEQ